MIFHFISKREKFSNSVFQMWGNKSNSLLWRLRTSILWWRFRRYSQKGKIEISQESSHWRCSKCYLEAAHMCEKHQREELKLFCVSCEKPCCYLCAISPDHKQIDVLPLEDFCKKVLRNWKKWISWTTSQQVRSWGKEERRLGNWLLKLRKWSKKQTRWASKIIKHNVELKMLLLFEDWECDINRMRENMMIEKTKKLWFKFAYFELVHFFPIPYLNECNE